MGLGHGPKPILNGLILNYDFANIRSYSGSGLTINNIIQSSFGATVGGFVSNSPPVFSSNNKGYLTFSSATGSSCFGRFTDFGTTLSTFTLEAWYYLTALPAANTVQALITQVFTGSNQINFSLGFNGTRLTGSYDGKINGGFWNGSWRLTTGFTPSINTWYQSVVTYDGTIITQYTNGVSIDTYDPGAGNRTVTNGASGNYLMRRWDDNNFIDGRLAIVKIYNRTLNDNEVKRNYDSNKFRFGLT